MNRRHLLRTLFGGGLTLLAARGSASASPQSTADMLDPHSFTDIPFRSLSQGYTVKGVHQRFTWAMGSLSSPRKVLFQAAVQQPAHFTVFRYDNTHNIPSVTEGRNNPHLWKSAAGGVNYVSKYLKLRAGTYVFMGRHPTTGTETVNCSMVIRNVILPGQPLPYTFVGSQPVLGVAGENTETPFGPFTVEDQNDIYFLRGCVNESNGGQSVEVLLEPQFLLWQQKKPYKPTHVLPDHFHSRHVLGGATGAKWYLVLKNPGGRPGEATNGPVSISYVWERWRKG